ncbi:MAG: hypothetical protein ABIH82_04905, partial [Candidatus Woesearchaeota archaeon]
YPYREEEFEQLEETIRRVHQRKIGLPFDCSFVFTGNQPGIIDWMTARTATEDKVRLDLEKLKILKRYLL